MSTISPATGKSPAWLFVVLGIIEIILGIIALGLPFVIGKAVVWILGVVFLVAMFINLYQVFAIGHYRWWNLISAIFYGLAGALILWNPTAAIVSLTILIGWLLIAGGVIRLAMSFRPLNGWLIFNGIVTLILGIIIVASWPASSAWVIGTFIAIDLIFSGWTLITLGTLTNRKRA